MVKNEKTLTDASDAKKYEKKNFLFIQIFLCFVF